MATTKFTDAAGREWCADFTVGAIKRVKSRHGIDLGRLAENEFAGYLQAAGDPVRLAEVLYCMCAAQHPGVTEDDFLESMAGESLHAAAEAFQEAFLLFCPSHQRTAMRALVAKGQEVEATILRAIVEKATETPAPAPCSTSATDSPASSESIPAR